MCGIAGILNLDNRSVDYSMFRSMLDALRHRGPDDEGYLFINTHKNTYQIIGGEETPASVFTSQFPYAPKHKLCEVPDTFSGQSYNLSLGNRRLSIIDLSPAGHQPMCNEDRTLWIVHNGEIYNFRDLRQELLPRGHRFCSDTDTEVILHAYEEWGPQCLKRFNGMWAFAIWDFQKQRLFCSRDRFGVKPFYYFFDGKMFTFASEIKALLALREIPRRPDDRAVYSYLVAGLSDHERETFFQGVYQLLGGEYLELDVGTSEAQLKIQRYWQLSPVHRTDMAEIDAVEQFRELLQDAVRLRLISDAPVGTCLSGGLDSSAIVCQVNELLGAHAPEAASIGDRQKTFSARYQDPRHDEGRFIEIVSQATNVKAYMTHPTADGLLADLEALIYAQDEPFGSTSIYAQWCVFKLACEAGVKVTLDGQGGDELLAGYHGYFSAYWASLLKSLRWVSLAREIYGYTRHHQALKERLVAMAYHTLPSRVLQAMPTSVQRTVRQLVGRPDATGINPDFTKAHGKQPSLDHQLAKGFNEYLYQTHVRTSLPALLRYADRNSMAHSIESRLPFLDYRIVQLVFSLPDHYKIQRGMIKWLLREAMRGSLPEEVRMRQDKIGFSTPEDEWFRGPLREFVWDVLTSSSFKARPYFDTSRIQLLFKRHCQGGINISTSIWRWVNLELWLRRFIDE